MGKKVLINIVGTPRLGFSINSSSILENIILCNENYSFDVVIHTSSKYSLGGGIKCPTKGSRYSRELSFTDNNDLKKKIMENYSILSKNINIIIESIDLNTGTKDPYKSHMPVLRSKRIYDLIDNINKYDYIISCRNDVKFIEKIILNGLENDLYQILAKKGGFLGYGDGDFGIAWICSRESYKAFNKCINHIWRYNEEDKTFYIMENFRFICPLFHNTGFPFRDKSYYLRLGATFNRLITNPNTARLNVGLDEIYVNWMTHFLKAVDSKWNIRYFGKGKVGVFNEAAHF